MKPAYMALIVILVLSCSWSAPVEPDVDAGRTLVAFDDNLDHDCLI